jgi:hypothetical protein
LSRARLAKRLESQGRNNLHLSGKYTKLNPPSLLAIAQTFEMVFSQYIRYGESKSLVPDGTVCKADTHGLLKRYLVKASGFHLIGKETERGWNQAEDISTLLPLLVDYPDTAAEAVRPILKNTSLSNLEKRTSLSRHAILRGRRGQKAYARSLHALFKRLRGDPRLSKLRQRRSCEFDT